MAKKLGGETQKHPRFTNREMELVKETFAENEELIKACYKVFFQLPLSEAEEHVIRQTFTKDGELRTLFDKLFCPGLENEQLFYGVDDWLDVQLDKPLEEALLYIAARAKSVRYITQQVKTLFNEPTDGQYKFEELTRVNAGKEIFINILARKEIIAKVRNMFGTLQAWAGRKDESAEEMMKRLFQNSSK